MLIKTPVSYAADGRLSKWIFWKKKDEQLKNEAIDLKKIYNFQYSVAV